jgi:hypothetical protein
VVAVAVVGPTAVAEFGLFWKVDVEEWCEEVEEMEEKQDQNE